LYGIVVDLPAQPAVAETRPVAALVDPVPVVTPAQVDLARWMSREYLVALWRCLSLMLPPGAVGHSDVEVGLTAGASVKDTRSVPQEQLFNVLDRRGPLRGRQLDRVLPRERWRRAASQLSRRGVVIQSSYLAPPRVRPKQVSTAEWAGQGADVEAALEGLRSDCYPAIVEFLRGEGGPVDVSWVYAATRCQRYHLNKLAERGLIAFDTEEVWRDPLADETFVPDVPPPLTSDQEEVWAEIRTGFLAGGEPSAYLLHGVTGSGKTEIYLRAVAEVLAQGRQAIVLLPEISLTPQTAHRFGARFGRRIAVLHSGLSDGQRYDAWRRARVGLIDIVIGPRSALFVPFPNLGLIVLDEEHSTSYKQEEIDFGDDREMVTRAFTDPLLPFYHARDTALELARRVGVTVILGSATPSLESYHRAQRGELTLLEMPRRIMGHADRLRDLQVRYDVPRAEYHTLDEDVPKARYLPLPPVHVVDMRAELRAATWSTCGPNCGQTTARSSVGRWSGR
jgi:primosomal protein N' (replication factor Y)